MYSTKPSPPIRLLARPAEGRETCSWSELARLQLEESSTWMTRRTVLSFVKSRFLNLWLTISLVTSISSLTCLPFPSLLYGEGLEWHFWTVLARPPGSRQCKTYQASQWHEKIFSRKKREGWADLAALVCSLLL